MDFRELGDSLLAGVRSYVSLALGPLTRRVYSIEKKLAELPVAKDGRDGVDGKDGRDGRDAPTLDEVAGAIKTDSLFVASLTGPKGDPGEPGAPGKDGRNASPSDIVAEIISNEDAVERLRGPAGIDGRDGKDGRDGMDAPTADEIVSHLMHPDSVHRAALRGPAGPAGADGRPGADGLDGRDAPTIGDILQHITLDEAAKAALRGPQGVPGEPGAPGKDGKPGTSPTASEVAGAILSDTKAVELLRGPPGTPGAAGRDGADGIGKDGAPGRDGINGKDGRDAHEITILPSISFDRRYAKGTYAAANGGVVRAARDTDPIGEGDLASAGWEVILNGIALVKVDRTGDRAGEIKLVMTDGRAASLPLVIKSTIYRGVFKEGTAYEHGDMVTMHGSVWHCEADSTTEVPMPGCKGWTLAVKHGRDGKDGKPGERGAQGERGKDGRDLTQMTLDGRRY